MNVKGNDRLKVGTPLFFSLVLILGMVLGFNLKDSLRNKRDVSAVFKNNDKLEEMIELINDKYVDSVNSNLLYKNAISGILKNLDPHTIFIPAENLQEENDDLEGNFSGIGVEYAIIRDTIRITSVVINGPAYKAGITVGDELIKVNEQLVAGNKITSEKIASLLRGKQKTNVSLFCINALNGKIKQLPMSRDIIPIHSVDATIMVDSLTGYIKISRFSSTTHSEFIVALKYLMGLGAAQLIIDLRDNPGGYLEAATSIADELLNDKKLIVYTKGLHSPKTEYRAGDKCTFETGKLAILINESSASASEILAGAIQDWDRGVIVGRRSFGKGLVQEQYDMADGAGLRLTIAKYYTPSGRCIQRSYAKGKDAYIEDYEKRLEEGNLLINDSLIENDTTRYYTSKMRVVYGNGGIKPDIYVSYDSQKVVTGIYSLIYADEAKAAVWDFFIHNYQYLKFNTINDYSNYFKNECKILELYYSKLSYKDRIDVQKKLYLKDNEHYFCSMLKAALARYIFNENGYYSLSLKEDKVVSATLKVLNSDEYLKAISR